MLASIIASLVLGVPTTAPPLGAIHELSGKNIKVAGEAFRAFGKHQIDNKRRIAYPVRSITNWTKGNQRISIEVPRQPALVRIGLSNSRPPVDFQRIDGMRYFLAYPSSRAPYTISVLKKKFVFSFQNRKTGVPLITLLIPKDKGPKTLYFEAIYGFSELGFQRSKFLTIIK